MRKILFCLALFLLGASHVFAAGEKPSFKSPSPFSIQMHSLTGEFENHKRSVEAVSELGIRQVRDECFWHIVEKDRGVYKIPEHVLKNLDTSLQAGLDTLIILNYANDLYDKGMAPSSEEAVKAFGRYCYTMAKELKDKVLYFEIWNEPNADGFWSPKADPVAYTRLLKEAYTRIKQGNPNAFVCGLSLSGLDEAFLWKVLDEGGYDFMDAISLHPYCHPKTPEEAEIFEKMEAIHERLAQYGSKKKDIWITEVGWPTNESGGISEYEQAVRIARTYLNALTIPFIKTVFIYWFGPDGQDREWAEDRFGIIHQDWSPKPAFQVYKTLITFLSHARFESFIIKDKDIRLAHFTDEKTGKHIYAVWGMKEYVEVNARGRNPVEVATLNGETFQLTPNQAIVRLRVGTLPALVLSSEALVWKYEPNPWIKLEFAGNSAAIPRGQKGSFKILTQMELSNPIVQFEREKGTGLHFEIAKDGYLCGIDPKANTGFVHFNALLTGGDAPNPSAYIETQLEISEPVDVNLSPLPPRGDEKSFLLSIKNLSFAPLSGTISFTQPDEAAIDKSGLRFSSLGLGETHTERVTIVSHHATDRIFVFKGSVSLEGGVEMPFEQLISFYECVRMPRAPKLDGDLSDWPENARAISLGQKDQYIAGYVNWEGPQDSSALVYTAWDEEWLYLGVEFQDDALSSPCAGFTVYNNDGIEIYMDADHEADRREAHYSSDDFQYGFSLERGKTVVYSWSQLRDYSRDSRIALNLDPARFQTLSDRPLKGMIMEGAIPMKELKITPRDGLHIGFNLALTDDDDPLTIHPFFQEIQFSWTRRKNSWQNPRVLGDLFFVDPDKKGALRFKGRQAYMDGKPFLPFGFWTYGWNEERFLELSQNGINALGVEFSWRDLEPLPGRFDPDYLKDCLAVLDLARKYGIHCVVQFGLHYIPDWLKEKYPELYFKKPNGERGEGSFISLCPDKSAFRKEIQSALEKYVTAMKDHPQVLGYSLWNEPGLSGDVCYCPDTLSRFTGTPPGTFSPGPEWLSWMRFRQDNFLEFFQWMKDVIRQIDQNRPLTIKGVWCPLDSRVAWAHGTRYDYWSRASDIMAHDPYPHPYDFFINRWVADWMGSSAPDKPAWYLEFNRAFGRERGLATPAEIRSLTYQALAHGITGFFYFFYPMNFFDPAQGDNHLAFSYSDTLKPVPALEEIYKISGEMKKIAPLIQGFQMPEPEIAILHSWPTQFQMAGQMFPTANETVPAQILYRLGYPVRYLTEDDMAQGRLQGKKILFVTGAVAVSDETLLILREYHKKGGHLFACAGFAALDEKGIPRSPSLPDFFQAQALETKTCPREKIALPDFEQKIMYNDHSEKIDRVERFRYRTSHPMQWESALVEFFYEQGIPFSGESFTDGLLIGFEDMKVEEEIIERVKPGKGAKVLASFGPLEPGIIATPQTLYVGRDLSWCDETMAKLVHAAVLRAGARRFAWITDESGSSLPNMDVGVLEDEKGRHLVIVTCSDRLYERDGTPTRALIKIHTSKNLTDILKEKTIQTKMDEDYKIIEETCEPGWVLLMREED